MKKRSFLHGAGILAAAGIVIMIIGFFFRVPLGNLIGGEGLGYYNAVYPVYTLLVVISTTGIPIAVSRLVAENFADGDRGGANRVFRVAVALTLIIGIIFFVVLFFGAAFITSHIQDLHGAVYAMQAIAPALILVPVMGAFRGYFQGMQNMKPTSVSQIIEQVFRVIFGLILAFFLVSMGLEYAAAGATFGATAGAGAGLVVMVVLYSKFRDSESFRKRREEARQARDPRRRESTIQIIKRIAAIAVPITAGAAIMPIMYNIDVWVVPSRLSAAGFDPVAVRTMYGQLTGFAEPITNLPKTLTQAIAISMVPTVVHAWKTKDIPFLHYNVSLGLRLALIIGLPCTVGLMVLPEPVMLLLYPMQPTDAVGASTALFIFAIGIVFLCSIDALTSVLQGVGKQMIPFVNIAIGAGCKLIITYTLTGIPAFNIRGAALGTVTAYAIATVLNYRAVRTYTGVRFDFKLTFARPLVSALVMGGVVAVVFYSLRDAAHTGNLISTIAAILIGAIVYIILLFATRSIDPQELKQLPKGERLYRLYRRFRPARNVRLR
ncbi:MAG: polysaccharide biosynthesis protein [Clostridiales bacterium]|nr:polysaccharide biosynthesis protein [Clostridiales bacterium]